MTSATLRGGPDDAAARLADAPAPAAAPPAPVPPAPVPFTVDVISHRTHMGRYPENSHSGLDAALASGVQGVEVDVRATQDGRVVLLHDRSLARTHGLPFHVDELTHRGLARLTRAQFVPSLDHALERCRGRARLVIDVKQRGIASLLRQRLEAHPETEAWVWTHDGAIARECINAFAGAVPVSLIVRPELVSLWGRREAMAMARRGGLHGLLFEHPDVHAPVLERAAEAGLALHCGRTDEPADIERMRPFPLTSICSDYPERLFAAPGAAGVHHSK